SARPVLLLLGLRERGQMLGEQEPLQLAILVQPPLPLGLVLDLAQGAGEPLRLEPRGDGAMPQVGLVRGRLLPLRPQAERLPDATRHRLHSAPPNDEAHPRRPLVKRNSPKRGNAAAVGCSAGFGGPTAQRTLAAHTIPGIHTLNSGRPPPERTCPPGLS